MQPIMDDLDDFPAGYFWYVQRWYDDDGVPHYHGVRSAADNIHEAQATIRFNLITAPVDLVYGPCTSLIDLSEYLGDVLIASDDEMGDIGTLGWLE